MNKITSTQKNKQMINHVFASGWSIMKKSFRKRSFYLLAVLIGSFALAMNSCIDDVIDDDEDPTEKFVGSWVVSENSQLFGQNTYNVNISINPGNSSEVIIDNFYMEGYGENVKALVVSNSLSIYSQTMCDGTKTVNGSGNYSNGTISISYTVNDGADIDNVTATYTQQ